MRGKPRKRDHRGREVWEVDWTDPLTRKRRRRLFALKREADAFQQEVNEAPKPRHTLHALVDPDVRLGDFAKQWFSDRLLAPKPWRTGTARAYREHLVGRLLPLRIGSAPDDVLGAVRIRDLHGGHVATLVTTMAASGFAPATTRTTLVVFGMLLDRAVARGLLPSDPITRDLRRELAPYVTPPDDDDDEDSGTAFTRDEARQFLAVTRSHSRLHALHVAGFCTGLRLGELLGLQLADHQGRRLRVARTLDPRCSVLQPITGPTKGGKERWVDVGSDLHAVLSQVAAARPKLALRRAWRPVPAWTFVTSNGTPFSQQAVRRDFGRMLAKAGLGDSGLTPHSMRHSFTCWHVERRCDLKWLQTQLGHRSIKVTMDVYARHATVTDHQAADALGATLLGNEVATTPTS